MKKRSLFPISAALLTVATAACGGSMEEEVATTSDNLNAYAASFGARKIKNEGTGHCLRPSGGSVADGARVVRSSCSDSDSRHWIQEDLPGVGGGHFRLVNFRSGLCLHKYGDRLYQRECYSTTRQQFRWEQPVSPFGAGAKLRVRHASQRCVRSNGGVVMSNCNNTSSRRWYKTL